MISSPREAAKQGRQDGYWSFKPTLREADVARETLLFRRLAEFDSVRQTYLYAHREGWYAAADQAAQRTKE